MRRAWMVTHPEHACERDLSLAWALKLMRVWGAGARISEC